MKGSVCNLEVPTQYLSGEPEENQQKLSWQTTVPADSNYAHPEYKTKSLSLQPMCLVYDISTDIMQHLSYLHFILYYNSNFLYPLPGNAQMHAACIDLLHTDTLSPGFLMCRLSWYVGNLNHMKKISTVSFTHTTGKF